MDHLLDQMDHFGITPIHKFASRYGRKKSPAVEPPSGLFGPNIRVVEVRLFLDVAQKLLTDLCRLELICFSGRQMIGIDPRDKPVEGVQRAKANPEHVYLPHSIHDDASDLN